MSQLDELETQILRVLIDSPRPMGYFRIAEHIRQKYGKAHPYPDIIHALMRLARASMVYRFRLKGKSQKMIFNRTTFKGRKALSDAETRADEPRPEALPPSA
jgi:repressor of nif and glnA expression